MITGILLVIILLAVLTVSVISFMRKGRVFHFLENRFPEFVQLLNEMSQKAFNQKKFWLVESRRWPLLPSVTPLYYSCL